MARTNSAQADATERVPAPIPRQMRVERQGDVASPHSLRHKRIIAGTCEFCGVIDPKQPAHYQYKLCPHYRGMQARCTYCPDSADVDQVVYSRIFNVAEHPDKPGVLIMWCDSYECSKKHLERFKLSA